MNNGRKAIVTDLSQIRKQKENKPYLNFAEAIIKQFDQGKTKEEVLHMILEVSGGLTADPREMKYFTDMVDIVYKWYSKSKGEEFQGTINELLVRMEKNQKYLYEGKDGKNYATRAELEAANGNYKGQITSKSSSKNL